MAVPEKVIIASHHRSGQKVGRRRWRLPRVSWEGATRVGSNQLIATPWERDEGALKIGYRVKGGAQKGTILPNSIPWGHSVCVLRISPWMNANVCHRQARQMDAWDREQASRNVNPPRPPPPPPPPPFRFFRSALLLIKRCNANLAFTAADLELEGHVGLHIDDSRVVWTD